MLFKKKKVYILEGYTWEPEHQYPLCLDNMVFTKYSKAKKELFRLAKTTKQEAKMNEWEVEIEWCRYNDTLEIRYDNGVIDKFMILERDII